MVVLAIRFYNFQQSQKMSQCSEFERHKKELIEWTFYFSMKPVMEVVCPRYWIVMAYHVYELM